MITQMDKDLMIPRVECIGNTDLHYPKSPFDVGKVLTLTERVGGWMYVDDLESGLPNSILQKDVDRCPHLFRRLHWREKRKPEEMPEYVKDENDVYKVQEWDETGSPFVYINDIPRDKFVWGKGHERSPVYEVVPATLEEYNQYINSKK